MPDNTPTPKGRTVIRRALVAFAFVGAILAILAAVMVDSDFLSVMLAWLFAMLVTFGLEQLTELIGK